MSLNVKNPSVPCWASSDLTVDNLELIEKQDELDKRLRFYPFAAWLFWQTKEDAIKDLTFPKPGEWLDADR